MIAAVYARKSTDQGGVSDEQKSVSRQIDRARAFAAAKGWTVSEEHVFVDDGISGAEFAKRPGFVRLMNSLTPYPRFDALIMSEESRLGRESIEVAYALKQITRADVRVFFYLDDRERTLDGPMDKAMLALQTMADEMERVKARQRTYDAMERRARAGYVTGGRTFGYDNVTVAGPDGKRSHVVHAINEQQAAVVRRVFELRAEGFGLKAIAGILNGDGACSPRPQRGRPNGWADSSVREILNRDKYRGVTIWNRTEKRDRDGQVRPRARPKAAHLSVPTPHLRIVSDEQWQTAHARMAADALRYTGRPKAGRPPGVSGGYLLTGMARCAVCNAGIEAHTRNHGGQRVSFYACARPGRSGPAVCTNRLAIRTESVDAAVLDEVERRILSAQAVTAAVRRAAQSVTAPCQDIGRIDAQIRELETRSRTGRK